MVVDVPGRSLRTDATSFRELCVCAYWLRSVLYYCIHKVATFLSIYYPEHRVDLEKMLLADTFV